MRTWKQTHLWNAGITYFKQCCLQAKQIMTKLPPVEAGVSAAGPNTGPTVCLSSASIGQLMDMSKYCSTGITCCDKPKERTSHFYDTLSWLSPQWNGLSYKGKMQVRGIHQSMHTAFLILQPPNHYWQSETIRLLSDQTIRISIWYNHYTEKLAAPPWDYMGAY